jgi:hypothetical protein
MCENLVAATGEMKNDGMYANLVAGIGVEGVQHRRWRRRTRISGVVDEQRAEWMMSPITGCAPLPGRSSVL